MPPSYLWRCRKTLGAAVHDNVSNVDNLLVKALAEGKLMMRPTENTLTKLCVLIAVEWASRVTRQDATTLELIQFR